MLVKILVNIPKNVLYILNIHDVRVIWNEFNSVKKCEINNITLNMK